MTIQVSVVIPCFCSYSWIEDLVDEVAEELAESFKSWEIILVNDSPSCNETVEALRRITNKSESIICYSLFANHGQNEATLCGLSKARGEIVVTMDDDFQHNPKNLTSIVEPIIGKMADSTIVSFSSLGGRSFYRSLLSQTYRHFMRIAGTKRFEYSGYRAISGAVAQSLSLVDSRVRISEWLFRNVSALQVLDFGRRPKRFGGKSGYNLPKLIGKVFTNYDIIALPLLAVVYFASLVTILVASVYSGVIFVSTLSGNNQSPGFPSLFLSQVWFSSLILLMVSSIGSVVISDIRNRYQASVRKPMKRII